MPITMVLLWWPIGVMKSIEAPTATAIRSSSGEMPEAAATPRAIGPSTTAVDALFTKGVMTIAICRRESGTDDALNQPVADQFAVRQIAFLVG